MFNRAVGTLARTPGQTLVTNHSMAWMFGPKSSRPQKTQLFGTTGTGG